MDISLENQPSGLYQVRVFSAESMQALPVVVKR